MRGIMSVLDLAERVLRRESFGFLVPLAPEGIVVLSLPFVRPEFVAKLAEYPKLFGAVTPAVITVFFSYAIGAGILTLVSAASDFAIGVFVRRDAAKDMIKSQNVTLMG
jgi:hypothetical protein